MLLKPFEADRSGSAVIKGSFESIFSTFFPDCCHKDINHYIKQ